MSKAPGGSGIQAPAGDSIVLEEEIDPSYEPTNDEVLEYAKWLGMDPVEDHDLLYIAREGLKAPLPDNWKPCKTADTEEIYYFNFATGESTWDHPCDQVRCAPTCPFQFRPFSRLRFPFPVLQELVQ
jgi:hypothetical protein